MLIARLNKDFPEIVLPFSGVFFFSLMWIFDRIFLGLRSKALVENVILLHPHLVQQVQCISREG